MTDSVPIEGEVPIAPAASGDARRFDVFLSHNSRDKPLVELIAKRLMRARLEPWLDAWQLVPGADWQRGLAEGLSISRSCAVFVGPSDLGAWENQEVAVALDRAARDPDFRVFLVLLPGLPGRFDAAELLPFLRMRTWVDYRGGLDDERAFLGLVSAVNGLPLGPAVPIQPDNDLCPYRGLEVFEEEHADFFFGRDADVQRLLEKLKGTRFLAVLGASGSGKSSLVRAGLVPALKRGAPPAEERWEIATLRPGAHPLETLAAHLLRLGGSGAMQQTLDGLAADSRTLHLAASLALSEQPPGIRLLLVVDQLEEVFTLCRDERERSGFFANLLYAATVPEGRSAVLLTMRADFYHRCCAYPELAQQLTAEQYLVSPMQPEGLRQALEEPARGVGLAFEPGLVATILEDVADQPGALPLLEHALLEVWRRRRGGMLTLAGYRDSGGVQGAIAKRADEVFESFEPERQELARRTFLRLTQPGEGTEDTRRRAQLIELEAGDANGDVSRVLARLVDARLVTTSRDETASGEVVEVAHEALIRGWPRLRAWIDEDREGLRLHRRLTEAAQEWAHLGREPGALYRGGRLAGATEWADRNDAELNEVERQFLDVSRAAERHELEAARRRARRLRALVLALAVFLLAAVGSTVLALREARRAEDQGRLALSRGLAGQSLAALERKPDLAILLSLEARRAASTSEARIAVNSAVERSSRMIAILHHGRLVREIQFSPDGRTLASRDGDGSVVLWDILTRKPLGKPLKGHNRYLGKVAFSPPDGKLLAVTALSKIRLWDVASGAPIRSLAGFSPDTVFSLAFSPDGKRLVSAGWAGPIRLWDVRSGKQLATRMTDPGDESVVAVALSPDGQTLASGGASGAIALWHLSSRAWLAGHLPGRGEGLNAIAFSPDGHTLASATREATISLWDVASRKPLGEPLRSYARTVAISPDGGLLAVADASPPRPNQSLVRRVATVTLWETASRRPRLILPGTDMALSVAFSRDGRALGVAGSDGTIILWDVHGVSSRPTKPAAALDQLCRVTSRNLTRAEWKTFMPGESYRKTCPLWPLEGA